MIDWRPGDIAIALADGKRLKKGRRYTILKVINIHNEGRRWTNGSTGPALVLAEVAHSSNPKGYFWHGLFDKLPFHEADEDDKETIDLYNKKTVKEQA